MFSGKLTSNKNCVTVVMCGTFVGGLQMVRHTSCIFYLMITVNSDKEVLLSHQIIDVVVN